MFKKCLVIQLFMLLLLLLNLGALNVHLGFVVGCHESERDALLKFKRSLTDDNNGLSSWEGKDCCNWYGVGCDNVTSYVNRLDLHNPSCDSDGIAKSGFISAPKLDHSLVELRHLNYFDLSCNYFGFSPVPGFIGSFKNLRYLNLSYLDFSGVVPSQLGNLTKLEIIDLSSVLALTSDIYWISTLPSLTELRLSECGLDIPPLVSLFSNSTWLSRIKQLDLSGNSLEGPLPHGIANMTSLTHLNLERNLFNGSLPHGFVKMASLTHLNIKYNEFDGLIPLSMRNMSKLEYVDLSFNSFTGVEGGDIMGILGNLCKLKTLDLTTNSVTKSINANHDNIFKCFPYDLEILSLGDNNITGTLPSWLWDFKYLRKLDISNNGINGLIPLDLGRLSRLEILDLSYNNLSGQLLSWIVNLTSLHTLDLSDNILNGTISESLGQCKTLSSIDLSSNFLQGAISAQHLANLSILSSLDLSFNNPLDLNISSNWSPPFQLSKLYMASCNVRLFPQWIREQVELLWLDLSDNKISGELPQWFSNINSLEINMSHNYITGRIPYFSSNLSSIDLSYNLLSGSLLHDDPFSKNNTVGTPICKLLSLEFLDLQNNKISGVIPDCWGNSEGLNYINLASNNLSGNIPLSLGLHRNLGFLKLSNNALQGPIPPTLSTCLFLQILDLGENKLDGNIPINWNKTTHPILQMLRLRENQFDGGIPPNLCTLPLLQFLDLAHNNLTGGIPSCFELLRGMPSLALQSLGAEYFIGSIYRTNDSTYTFSLHSQRYDDPREDSTAVVLKGAELQYSTTLEYVVNLDLSCNALVGSIPEEITNLVVLIGLNLSHNFLTGNIPNKIGEMRSLVSLDLSNNKLSGTIPSSMSDLTWLSALNLSYNNLHGQIPTGSQLQTLNDPSSYKGNLGLCGDPLPNKCKTSRVENQPVIIRFQFHDQNSYWDKPLFYFVIFSGFATGFWGVVGSLLLKRRFRWALFQFVDNITDYMYVQLMIKFNRIRN